ncbi:MAG: UDP-N-acetylmuramate--L-alanine ligase [Planctomycetes bacterium]|nr:UDP-N-acetylmuramate--L-alanine ligase [Planctomycetota bacterium]
MTATVAMEAALLAGFASRRFHCVGVGGAGMSGLARLLMGMGGEVSGSDSSDGPVLRQLLAEGCDVWFGGRPERVAGADGYVIRSAAVPAADAEVQECVRRGFTSLLYAEAVGRLSEGRRTLAIGGTHGKTTTTALTVAGLRAAGQDPSHLIGGDVPEFAPLPGGGGATSGGNGYGGRGQEFVVEACEFNRSFHSLRPFGAAILNVDHDHFDCYPSSEELIDAFAGYLGRIRPGGTALVDESVPRGVLNSLRSDVTILTVGSGLWADIRAIEVRDEVGRFAFVPVLRGERLPRVRMQLPGRHNMQNALFALGLAHVAGADPVAASRGLAGFGGVSRRFELHHGAAGGLLVNDYAHHPVEIQATLAAARRRFPDRRLLVAFQPHQFQRTRFLLSEFAEALCKADLTLVVDIYGARETDTERGSVSALDLVDAVRERGGRCGLGGSVAELPARVLEHCGPRDVVLVLGAGDVDRAVGGIVAAI